MLTEASRFIDNAGRAVTVRDPAACEGVSFTALVDVPDLDPLRVVATCAAGEAGASAVNVSLDNGKSFEVTAATKVVTSDGSFVPADQLKPGDGLRGLGKRADLHGGRGGLPTLRVSSVSTRESRSTYAITIRGSHKHYALAAGVFVAADA